MGIFLDELKKAMAEQQVSRAMLTQLNPILKKHQALVNSVFRGIIPRNLVVIDAIADALKKPKDDFHLYAALDNVERERAFYDLTWEQLFKTHNDQTKKKTYIPIYKVPELIDCLSLGGYPARPSDEQLAIVQDYGASAYAVQVSDYVFSPRVRPGEVAILSGDYPPVIGDREAEEFGSVRTATDLFFGKLFENPSLNIVESVYPGYAVHRVPTTETLFVHRIVGIYRPLQ